MSPPSSNRFSRFPEGFHDGLNPSHCVHVAYCFFCPGGHVREPEAHPTSRTGVQRRVVGCVSCGNHKVHQRPESGDWQVVDDLVWGWADGSLDDVHALLSKVAPAMLGFDIVCVKDQCLFNILFHFLMAAMWFLTSNDCDSIDQRLGSVSIECIVVAIDWCGEVSCIHKVDLEIPSCCHVSC